MLAGAGLSSVIAAVAITTFADAHGHLNQPLPTFQDGASHVNWVTQIVNYWDIGSGGDQVGKYKALAKEKGVSVRDVLLDMVGPDKKCGFTRTDVAPKPVPTNGKAVWLGNDGGGFTHVGPCELYIDDKTVLHSDNCQPDYPGGPNDSGIMSEMPVDYSSCNGDCVFSIYWLGFQNVRCATNEMNSSRLGHLLVTPCPSRPLRRPRLSNRCTSTHRVSSQEIYEPS